MIMTKRIGTQEQSFGWVNRNQTSSGPYPKAKIILLAFISENSSLRKSRVTCGDAIFKPEQAPAIPRLREEKDTMIVNVTPAAFQNLNFNSLCNVHEMKPSLFFPFSLPICWHSGLMSLQSWLTGD